MAMPIWRTDDTCAAAPGPAGCDALTNCVIATASSTSRMTESTREGPARARS